MFSSALCVNAGHACAAGLAQQIVAGKPPAYGAVQQQFCVVSPALGIGHPDHQVGTLRIKRMAQILTKVPPQCLVLGHGALTLCGQCFKSLPQQISTKALGESRVGHGQGLGYRPGLDDGMVSHVAGSMRVAMGKLCHRKGRFAMAKPAICLEELFVAAQGAGK
jgi:hypothetical protein